MRTKRKNYQYDSSDYDNGDYEQEDFEGEEDDFDDEDQVEESGGDSDYGDSGNENGRKNAGTKSKVSKSRNHKDQEEDIEDTYEDEDPFSPEIDQILADKQIEIAQVQSSLQCNSSLHFIIRIRKSIKFSEPPSKYIAVIDKVAKLVFDKIYGLILPSCKMDGGIKTRGVQLPSQQEQISRQAILFKPQKVHHFSDDEEEEEEDEEGAIKGLPLPIIPMVSDDITEQEVVKQVHIKVEDSEGEDLTQYFDKNYTIAERVLSTTLLFPVIHPRQAKQIRGKWQDDCMKAVNVLANFRKNNVPIGLAFSEQLDAENEDLADYFKIIKQPIDLVMIMNRLYNKQKFSHFDDIYRMYQQPSDFWNDLGLVFKNCRSYYKSQKRGLRKQCDALRCLAYHLYNDWYQEQKNRFITGVALPPQPIETNQQTVGGGPQSSSSITTGPMQLTNNGNNNQTNQPIVKDSIIVNLQSLLRSQQSANDSQKKNQQQENNTQNQLPINQVPNLQQQPQQQQPPQQINITPQIQQNQFQQPQNPNDLWNLNRAQQQQQQQQQPVQQQQQPFQPSIGGFPSFPNQLQPPQQQQQQQQLQPQNMSFSMSTPSLPSINQIMMNPMASASNSGPQSQQNALADQFQLQQLQQQMNQGFMPSNLNNLFQNPNQFMNPPVSNQLQQQQQQPQADWMIGSVDKNIMKSFLGVNPAQIDQTNATGLQLPSIGNAQQSMIQNSFVNPFQQQSMMELNQLQAMQQQQEKSMNLLNQMMGLQGTTPNGLFLPDNIQQMAALGGGPQDFNQLAMRNAMGNQPGQLPSLSQISGFKTANQLGVGGGFQLPSLSQMNQSLGSQMSTYDPYGNSMMGMMQQQNPQSYMNQLMNPQQNMLKFNPYTNNLNPPTTFDEMMILQNLQQQSIPSLQPGYNPFGQLEYSQNQAALMGLSNQFPSFQQNQASIQNTGHSHQNAFKASTNPNNNLFNPPMPLQQQQTTRLIDPNLIQPDNLDQYNEKQQDPPVPPCIMDPGAYDLSWILEPGETVQDLEKTTYLTEQEIQNAVKSKNFVDQLYLVKWKSLSYSQSTWEPESFLKGLFDDKIQDYNRFNRSLDQFQRERLDQLIKNHKKMLRVTEKKYQNKRMDQAQEAYMSLQEARVNRQLLNSKIQEIMGDHFYSIIQYSEKQGIVPQFKKPHQQLKDYQILGLNWLIRAWHENRNVVLADEMGLGKTIMTLSLFDHLNKVYKLRGPYLILAPLTTLEHWKRIADEWTTLNSVLYYDPGSSEGRNEIRYWEWFYTDVTYKGQITQKSELYKFNIIITSFEVFMQDLNPILSEIPFTYIVVDEAHRLKNKQAKTLKLLKDHPCKRILLLTGTPVQNNTKELWTLLNYIEPEKFDSLENFLEQYGNLETYEQIQKLHTILKPHFLRRLKEEVDNSIPPLQETVIEVGLTTLQNTYYKGIYGENRMVLAKFGTNSIKTSQLNNIDVQLRKCCNHLFLLKGVEEELTRECRTEEDIYKKLLESSGKLMLLDKFIEKFKEENHKMLIFSQFKRMLDVIELYLKMKAVPYEKLTGSVKTQDRISAIQRFNDDKTFGVFLLTTRAGGLGINLTSARVVIIFDSDWNPQNDLQAIARAHRIGQKFEVQVYRLITSKTYEEQMFERASKKLGMEQALFSKGAFHQTDDFEVSGFHLRGLTELKQDSKEIENLLKYGAYAFIEDGDENEQVNFNKDIDEILATGKKKEFTYSKGIYTLQKSTFNASKYESLPDVNDPDFWNKVLPYDSIISICVLEKKFKKEKKEMGKNEKLQKEFFKDLEIVFNDFMDAKFDVKTSVATKKQLESDEEKLREILKKMIRLSGMKLIYVEKCKEWLRDMLRTNKRKKPVVTLGSHNQLKNQASGGFSGAGQNEGVPLLQDEEFEAYEDDIIIYDSDEQDKMRQLRQRNPAPVQAKADNDKDQPLLKKRGRKPKNAQLATAQQKPPGTTKSFDESEAMDEEDEEELYEDEEDKDYVLQDNQGSRKYQQQDDDYNQDSDDEPEAKYSLRGNRKRQKTGREDNFTSQGGNLGTNGQGSNYYNQSSKNTPKINDQFVKRNEKNGIVCAYCLHPELPNNLCIYFCQGYCQRFFHEECKDTLFGSDSKRIQTINQGRNNLSNWQCDDCLDNKALCYCCKQKGQILVFPKKGKPKAAGGFSDQQQASINLGEEDDDQEQDQFQDQDQDQEQEVEVDELFNHGECGNNIDDLEGKINHELINDDEDEEEIMDGGEKLQAQLSENKILEDREKCLDSEPKQTYSQQQDLAQPEGQSSSSNERHKEQDQEMQQQMNEINQDQDQEEEKSDQKKNLIPIQQIEEGEEQKDLPQISKEVSTKIVLSNIGPLNKPTSSSDLNDQKLNTGLQTPSPEPNDKRFVVRCTLGGCFKYYHVECVYKNKNVSCINSMKVQRFRCPLHYCEICQASGDSVLIVQCVTCPTAYHLKCLPQDLKAIRLTKKYIICGKHNMSQEDFPKYEEKSGSSLYQRNNQSNSGLLGNQGKGVAGADKKKKKIKKRGRKPKQSSAVFDYEEESAELEPDDYYSQQQQQETQSQPNLNIQKVKKDDNFNLGGNQQQQISSFTIKIGDDSLKSQQQQKYSSNQLQQHSSTSSAKGEPISSAVNVANAAPKRIFQVEKTTRSNLI